MGGPDEKPQNSIPFPVYWCIMGWGLAYLLWGEGGQEGNAEEGGGWGVCVEGGRDHPSRNCGFVLFASLCLSVCCMLVGLYECQYLNRYKLKS